MSIVRVIAELSCDECGQHYHTLVDNGSTDVFDSAVSGRPYDPETKMLAGMDESVSYDNGEMRCVKCTTINDARNP